METRNVLLAVIFSTIVLVFWATFFEAPILEQKTSEKKITQNEELSSPSIEEKEVKKEITRNEIIKKSKGNRIKVENENIKGSISLEGAIIDDIIFKNYKETLNSENKVVFLNPKNSPKEYYIETGWATGGDENIKLPLINTIWKNKGNNILTPNNPVILEWDNGQGLLFTKKIELDEKFLFKITQNIKNNSNKAFQFYPYAQITRGGKQEGMQIYILHEGFLGVFGEELVEKDYDDIEKEKFTVNSSKGWLGITDKYWLTAIVPEKGSEFKAEFVAKKEKYRANYIIKEAKILNPGNSITNEINTFVAAKEVDVIDNYAEQLGIEKFDLAIDWGWFYFFTKPLFFIIDYFFKLTGNFGWAIVIITALVRLIFFPLANYSFKSMAKMKILQPEMGLTFSLLYKAIISCCNLTLSFLCKSFSLSISGCRTFIFAIDLNE